MSSHPGAEVRDQPFRLDAVPLSDLHAAATDAGFTAARTEQLQSSASVHGELDTAYLHRSLDEPTAFNTLVRLFLLGDSMRRVDVTAALGDSLVERLLHVGVLSRTADDLRAMARIAPYRDLLLASDRRPDAGGQPQPDHVLGIAPTSDILARLTVRRHARNVLDLGTGCGVHALLAAPHADHTIATDLGDRALAFARLNARINGIETVECRRGAFFEPVADARFDLIVSNPPFAISPESRYLYRDAGAGVGSVSEAVVRGAATHLEPDGFAISLISWHHDDDDDWADRPCDWIRETGCDAWLLHAHSVAPLDYAAFFLRQTELHDPADYARQLDAWTRFYEERGMHRLAVGTIVLRRRRHGPAWFRADTVPADRIVGDAGAHIEIVFHNEDLIRSMHDERELLDRTLRLNPGHVLEHRLRLEDGGWQADSTVLRLTRGVVSAGSVDAPMVQLLQGCDGQRPFRAAVDALAAAMEIDPAEALPRALRTAVHLLRSGILQA